MRTHVAALIAFALLLCATRPTAQISAPLSGPRPGETAAGLVVSDANASLTQTGETSWSLGKTGALSGETVTWTIAAQQIATTAGQLVVNGYMTVTNTGRSPATIGNIVANLQTKSGSSWITRSSDVADATNDDAATSAKIVAAASSENHSTFSENSASGALLFTDASNNSTFALVPQKLIPAGASVSLLYSASYDNNVLHLATGSTARAEVIISFGNATTSNGSAANIDINGNGTIDADEARVRGVPSRLTLKVPPQTTGNATPTLSDTLADITATGTVTFSNASFNLNATGGTVTATVNGGASGGTITNCAHLTSPGQTVTIGGFTFTNVGALNLQRCKQVSIGVAPTCQVGDAACRWHTGDMSTRTQQAWDSSTGWYTDYNSVYESTFGAIEVGIPGSSGHSMQFGGASDISAYLVAAGTPAALNADLVNPTTSSSGQFGGEVLALKLNVDFSAAGKLGGSSGLAFGSLTLCDMAETALNGTSVSGLLTIANTLLGGGANGYAITAINAIAAELNSAFASGTPSTWAQQHLFVGGCGWPDNTYRTYTQTSWEGTGKTTLETNYETVFASTFGTLTIGDSAGFTASWSSYTRLEAYLPQSGDPAPLNASSADATFTSSGLLGAHAVALTLNVSFSDAGVTPSDGSLAFGDVHVCGTNTAADGQTARGLLAFTNSLLSFGPQATIDEVEPVLGELNASFENGTASAWAQTHLFAGACP